MLSFLYNGKERSATSKKRPGGETHIKLGGSPDDDLLMGKESMRMTTRLDLLHYLTKKKLKFALNSNLFECNDGYSLYTAREAPAHPKLSFP